MVISTIVGGVVRRVRGRFRVPSATDHHYPLTGYGDRTQEFIKFLPHARVRRLGQKKNRFAATMFQKVLMFAAIGNNDE